MSLPHHLLAPGALRDAVPGSTLVLDGDEGRHAVQVRRTRVGERIGVADGAGTLAVCTVVEVGRDRLEARVDHVTVQPPRTPRLVLVQALAKGGRDELAVEAATELGVDAVVPWQAHRSVSRWLPDKAAKGTARWRSCVREAAKQARRATVPQVEAPLDTPGLLTRARAGGAVVLVLHEDATVPLGAVASPGHPALAGASEVVLVVGPEGGVDPAELADLCDAGALAVRLGPEVLRTSTAGPVALAVLSDRLGRWDGAGGAPSQDAAP